MSAPTSPAPYLPVPKTKGLRMFGIRLRRRTTVAATTTASGLYGEPSAPAPHACSTVLDGLPQLESPLITELVALQAHTRNLGWLTTREECRDEYQHLARLVLQHLLDGWQNQTHGRGRLEDLLLATASADLIPHGCQDDHSDKHGQKG